MKRKRILSAACCLVLCGVVLAPLAPAAGQESGREEGGKVYAVQKKEYRMKNELYASVGVLPMDAFYKGITFGGGYTRHFSHHFGWEVFQFLYSSNVDTGLKKDLEDIFAVEPSAFREVKMLANSNIVFVPLYGKMSWLNRKVVQMELYLTGGPGVAQYKDYVRQGAEGYAEESKYYFSSNFGIGLRFFFSKKFSGRLDLRDYMNFVEGDLDNAAYFSLGLSWNFQMPKFSGGDEEE